MIITYFTRRKTLSTWAVPLRRAISGSRAAAPRLPTGARSSRWEASAASGAGGGSCWSKGRAHWAGKKAAFVGVGRTMLIPIRLEPHRSRTRGTRVVGANAWHAPTCNVQLPSQVLLRDPAKLLLLPRSTSTATAFRCARPGSRQYYHFSLSVLNGTDTLTNARRRHVMQQLRQFEG